MSQNRVIKARRLGKPEENKYRPLVLIRSDGENNKRNIFSILHTLKEKGYINLTVSHDTTLEEKQEGKRLAEEAKEKKKTPIKRQRFKKIPQD